jgi:hypothetical protein
VVAESFARIFFRNSVATGELYPVESTTRICETILTGDEIELDLDANTLKILKSSKVFATRSLGDARPVIDAGGLFDFARQSGMISARGQSFESDQRTGGKRTGGRLIVCLADADFGARSAGSGRMERGYRKTGLKLAPTSSGRRSAPALSWTEGSDGRHFSGEFRRSQNAATVRNDFFNSLESSWAAGKWLLTRWPGFGHSG